MSENNYNNGAKESLDARYWRGIELLFHISRDIYLPARVIANTLFADDQRLNKGNNWRTMKEYLNQFQDAGWGKWSADKHYFILSDFGRSELKRLSKVIQSYTRPLRYSEEILAQYQKKDSILI